MLAAELKARSDATIKIMIENGMIKPSPETAHGISIGQIFVCSWGCEQTNVDFYEVVRLKGKQSLVVHKVAKKKEYIGDMDGFCTPAPDDYTDSPEFTVRVKGVKSEAFFRLDYANAYFTEHSKKHRFSEYA